MPTKLVTTQPLTASCFTDLEVVFSQKGCSFARGCWCMEYRETGRQVAPEGLSLAEVRKQRLRDLANSSAAPGLMLRRRRPAGRLGLAGAREAFAKLPRSPVMKPVDDRPVWSVVCFVVPSPYRGEGVATALLRHAIAHARSCGGQILEAYPIDKPGRSPGQWLWHGTRSMFDRAGFYEVARRKAERPVMRL
ncbi:MAG: GNAT family N-acetyltransferase, partial [Rhodospirillales bacterium]